MIKIFDLFAGIGGFRIAAEKVFKNKIETNISPVKNYCKAEEYHQKYIEKNRR